MKKIKFSFLFITLLISNVYGADYQCINSNRIAYFEDTYKNIRAIKIDSVKYESDSILYPYRNIHQLDHDCFSPTKFSWLGSKIHIKENGDNLFFNKYGEVITLKTKAILNEKWVAYQIENSLIIEAKVVKQDTIHFLGLVDSVKIIAFQAYDENMNSLDYNVNDMIVIISKNHGFIKTMNFIAFPNTDTYREILKEYNLVGLSNPKVGIQNLTTFDIYDFNVDDELHILTVNLDGQRKKTGKEIYKYLERIDYEDSIVYYYSRKLEILEKNGNSEISSIFYNDTLKLVVKKDFSLDKLPEEPTIDEYGTFCCYMRNDDVLSKIDPSRYDFFYFAKDSCWSEVIFDGYICPNVYLKGLGGPYYSCKGIMGGISKELVYYKKGNKTWGEPIIISNIVNIKPNNQIKIYPNPTKDGKLYIHFNQTDLSEYTIDIIGINGKIIKSEIKHSSQTMIDLSNLVSGLYLYKISDRKGSLLETGKIIIQ